MAQYTVTLNEYASYISYGETSKRKKALEEWLFYEHDYDVELKGKFQPLFVNRYFFEEMGLETPELFRDRVNERLDEIIPYYDEMYQLNKYMLEWDFMEPDIDYMENGAGSESGSLEDLEKNGTFSQEGYSENRNANDGTRQWKTRAENNLDSENRIENNESSNDSSRTEFNAASGSDMSNEDTQKNESETKAENENFSKNGEGFKALGESKFHSRDGESSTVSDEHSAGQKSSQESDKQITEGNGATSNYPQANVISDNDYYTNGNESNQKIQKQNNITDTASDTSQKSQNENAMERSGEGRSETQNESTRNMENVSRGGTKGISGKIIGIKEMVKNDNSMLSANGTEFKKSSGGVWVNRNGATSGSEDIREMLNRMDAVNRTIGRSENAKGRRRRDTVGMHSRAASRKGRMTRRPIPQIIRDIENTYRNIPLEMTKEFEDLFMGIW